MSREHNDFVDLDLVSEVRLDDGPFAGAGKRVLSADAETGAETAVLRCPAGWSAELDGVSGSLELLALTGGLGWGAEIMPREGWARAPRAKEVGRLTAAAGAEVLIMTDPSAQPEGGMSVVDVKDLRWQQGVRGGPGGIAVKTLYEGRTVSLIIANVPRYLSGPEFHDCPEELFVLAGDVEGRAGKMTRGSYFWRPGYITHGPYWSEAGLLTFVRGHGDLVAYWMDNSEATPEQNRTHLEALRRAAAGGAGR